MFKHRIAVSLVFAFLAILLGNLPTHADVPNSDLTVVRAARLYDVKTSRYVPNPMILVANGRIKSISSGSVVPEGVKVIDLGDATLLPGLIDCHTHLLQKFRRSIGDDDNIVLTVAGMSTAKRALLGARMGLEDLEAGITTVRDAGNSGIDGAIDLRDAVNAGWVVGPHIVACGRALSPSGGQFPELNADASALVSKEYLPVNGVEEARRAVRQSIARRADAIKVIVDSHGSTLSNDEMRVIVEEAHRAGKKVAAHAISDLGVDTAIAAGVDSIEHAYALNPSQATEMARKGIFLVPTDMPAEVHMMGYDALTPEARARWNENYKWFTLHCRQRLAIALKAGVRVAAGSDMYYDLPGLSRGGASLKMLSAYAEAGMPATEIIRAATLNAAELLGIDRDTGSVETGKWADLIAVKGDPLQDITELQKVAFVMKAGTVVKNESGTAKSTR